MLNMDLTQRVVIETETLDWIPSPAGGVNRRQLEREAAESGHVTSIVEYLPGTAFPEHIHPMGEEILVLDGVFSDETGDYGKGTYIRNPPGSRHSPFSKYGCIIFVKLNQFLPDDLETVRIDTLSAKWVLGIGNLSVLPLHEFKHKNTSLIRWPAGERLKPHCHFGGEETYVISGELEDEFGRYPKGSWMRCPHMSEHTPVALEDTLVWVKTGHLPEFPHG
ncbi:cupin domain-containing protein [Parasalinivibrio latis]|uniref:cupin domain-containing protein n=1 Tax=Parasalinivibrio latis TaxID=2952610 RepID=UPI0030DE935E